MYQYTFFIASFGGNHCFIAMHIETYCRMYAYMITKISFIFTILQIDILEERILSPETNNTIYIFTD